jgi:hypothetical protein
VGEIVHERDEDICVSRFHSACFKVIVVYHRVYLVLFCKVYLHCKAPELTNLFSVSIFLIAPSRVQLVFNPPATAATRAKANFKRRVLLVVSGRVR